MTKIETAETIAAKVTASMQPAVTFDGAAHLKQPVPPTVTPLPADLARALGQTR